MAAIQETLSKNFEDDKYVDENEFSELYEDTDKVSKKIANFIKYLNSSKIKRLKFKERM